MNQELWKRQIYQKNINIYKYSAEFTPTESHAGWTLLSINNKLSYKIKKDLCIYKSNE